MCTVVNKYKVNMDDPDIVYIRRGSVWGNPFPMKDSKDDAERLGVIEAYRYYLKEQIRKGVITKEMLKDLNGKRLACFCSPKPCHGDVIVRAVEWAVSSS